VLQSGESEIGFLFGGGKRRKIVIFGEEYLSTSIIKPAQRCVHRTFIQQSRARKVSKVPPRAALKGKLYCFKVLVVLGRPAEARWEEEVYAFLF
jgi:hypothetical protein